MHTETEARYSVPAPDQLDRLRALHRVDRYTLGPRRPTTLTDVYVDTPGCDLAQLGWACRLRQDEAGWRLTLKGPREGAGAVVTRVELETQLTEPLYDPRRWPDGPWRDEALQLLGAQPLSPWVTIRQTRELYTLSDGDRAVAELAIDAVDLGAGGSPVRMIECELLPAGQPDDLRRITDALEQALPLTPEPRSKLEMALAARADSSQPDAVAEVAPNAPGAAQVRPEDTIVLAAAKVIERYLSALLSHELGARLGQDAEEIHDMRVATRRLRSALRLLRPFLRSPNLPACELGLRKLAAYLGTVRDLDVALEHAAAFTHQSAGEPSALQPLTDVWEMQRATAHVGLVHYLDRKGYRRLLKRLRALLAELYSSSAGSEEGRRVHSLVPRLLHVRWQAVLALGHVAPGAPIELLHQLRIECKRLRYALECFRDALPDRQTAAIPAITALQDHLGELHDAAVRVEWIDRWTAERGDMRGIEGVLAYRQACQARAAELERSSPEAWLRLSHYAGIRKACRAGSSTGQMGVRRRWRWFRRANRASRP